MREAEKLASLGPDLICCELGPVQVSLSSVAKPASALKAVENFLERKRQMSDLRQEKIGSIAVV